MKKNAVVVEINPEVVLVAEFEDRGPDKPILAVNHGFCRVAFGTSVKEAIQAAMNQAGIRQRTVIVSAPTVAAFMRFVKLPSVSEGKIKEVVAYEIEQSMPENLVWDYSFIRNSDIDKHYSTCMVGMKDDHLMEILECIPDNLKVLGVAVNGIGVANFIHAHVCKSDGECEMALVNGSKTTDICFVERDKLYIRTIPKTPTNPEDQLIDEKGELAPFGRNLFTRLYGELSRIRNFYKSQQDGNAPVRAWTFNYDEETNEVSKFFSEKLGIPVNQMDDASILEIARRPDEDMSINLLASLAGVALGAFGRGIVDIQLKPKNNPNAFVRWWRNQSGIETSLKNLLVFSLFLIGICLILTHAPNKSTTPVVVAPETNQALVIQCDDQAFLLDLINLTNMPTNIIKVESFSLNAFSAYSDKLSTRKVFIEGRLCEDDKGSIMAGSSWVEALADRLSHSENYKLGRRVCDIQVDRTIQKNAEGIWTFIVTCQFDLAQ